MKVLFVSSGNNKFGISPIVKAQGESLIKSKIDVEYFTIVGRGIYGYLKNILRLRKYLDKNKFDLVHSHFFLSSVVATLSNPKYLVVSLMGSDVYTSALWNLLIRLFHKRWNATIVKSEKMKEILRLDDLYVIPNGVDFEMFYPIEKHIAREKLGWNKKRYIIFASSPKRLEKNFALAEEAVTELKTNIEVKGEVELVALHDIPHDLIVYYLNAADVLLMTSKYEGSPNIIKEAMACNCPIVSTDVGDVAEIIKNTQLCFITDFNPRSIAKKIILILNCDDRTNGREKITHLNDKIIAEKILKIYIGFLTNHE